MKADDSIFIGTSGWSYKDRVKDFYPEKTKPVDFLKYYAKHFQTVEVNTSFYHTLKNETIINWTKEVPDNFLFAIKAERYITHTKRLEEPEKTVPVFLKSLSSFYDKLGPVLFQLPPSLKFDEEKLKSFVDLLPDNFSFVFEFRNKTWFNDKTYEILKNRNLALCIYNLAGYESPWAVTADFAYLRFHGTEKIGVGKYTDEDIQNFSKNILKILYENKKVYCYFNNDVNGSAFVNAQQLIEKISCENTQQKGA